jgi:S-methylmethionine-dependent homocysteine/selenocysteine methylase
MSYAELLARIDAGEVVVIDGGTGTEVQRRGVAMDGDTWCAEANIGAPDIVREVHASYIAAGAELVIANTYATSPLLFDHLGRSDDVERIDRIAVALARQAADGRALVGGSISVMRPVVAGGDRNVVFHNWTETRAREMYRRKAETMAAAGVDVLVMEMMRDTDYSVWATEEALATGLPVWVGIAVERGADPGLGGSGLVGSSRPDCSLEAIVDAIAPLGPDLIAIMHSSPNDTDPALDVVSSRTDVRLGAYPESGFFEMPDWRFVDIISVADLVVRTRRWIAQGARVVGGCCGISPEHIAGLTAAFGHK